MTSATALRSRHLLGIADLDPDEIDLVLDTALAMKEIGTRSIKKVPDAARPHGRQPVLRGRARGRGSRSSWPRSG